jgi:hypothetical protein
MPGKVILNIKIFSRFEMKFFLQDFLKCSILNIIKKEKIWK